ncbi:MAG TPA: hypothetical protein ENI14_01835 [Thermoplasmatales archaeon]|nr:hypothetical protein [Thermoplasmatales archaeon]
MSGVMRLLSKALKNKFEMSDDDAKALARIVKNVFNGKKEVEDSSIDKYVRALFYELQKERLVKVRREEYKEKNRFLRRYYWYLNMEVIKEEANKVVEEDPGKIYRVLPKRVWLSKSRYNS